MNIKLGFAVSSLKPDEEELVTKLERVLEFESDAVELSLTKPEKFNHPFTEKSFKLLKRFKYRSIHAPARNSTGPIIYPSEEADSLLDVIDKIIGKIDPQTILFHPDTINDFGYINERYGSLVSFENMDNLKTFGRTIEDMAKVFERSPQAKWVFDVNHLYTNDKNMNSAKEFYETFKDRLTHYHVSGYGTWHECFSISHEDIILKGVFDMSKPMIHEGNAVEKGLMNDEYAYIRNVCCSKNNAGV